MENPMTNSLPMQSMNAKTNSPINEILEKIIDDPSQHAKFLNTLSFLENTGSREISAMQSDSNTSLSLLKHASEESRHAYFIKKQIPKVNGGDYSDYRKEYLFAPKQTKRYLRLLEIKISRHLKDNGYWSEPLFLETR